MLHALGRPKNAHAVTASYRNHYVIGKDSEINKRNQASPYWEAVRLINDDRDAVWIVTNAGQAAVRQHLMEQTDG